MKKLEMVKAIQSSLKANDVNITLADISKVLSEFPVVLTEAIKNGESYSYQGIGTFSMGTLAPTTGRNPRTGEELVLGERKTLKFSKSKKLVEELRKED